VVGAVQQVGSWLGFAEGGQIPEGFPNDNFPMRATSGEYVIDKDTTKNLQRYLEQQGSGGGQAVHITLKVGEQELARTLVSLDRRGFRI
jgi:hypothetical protein